MNTLRPIDECPEFTDVLFFIPAFGWVIGQMERNRQRVGGHRKDYYWGGPWANNTDAYPPIGWQPLPQKPE